ncbi:MAG: NAD-dependent epimerase/dehydratase family protein [Pseudomonadota bacterium]
MSTVSQHDRRQFLKLAGAAGLLAAGVNLRAADTKPDPKHLLILGGTGFLGPHIVKSALSRGHKVTLFNRGKTAPDMFPDVETLIGDRDGQLDALKGRDFDGVIDTSAYVPRISGMSAELLQERVPHYLFVSTISVYQGFAEPGMTEDAPLAQLTEETEQVTGATYGALKALSEEAVYQHYPESTTVVRPGLIVGPLDKTDRFTYWPVRARRGGEILAPGEADTAMQFIDVRDQAEFIVLCMENGVTGTMNTDRPAGSLTTSQMLDACLKFAPAESKLTWVPADFLAEQNVAPWQDLPAWIPPAGNYAGFGRVSTARAEAAGLTIRPLSDTISGTLAWFDEAGRTSLRAGLSAEREAEVLKAWHASA